jgi:hypothetical protein
MDVIKKWIFNEKQKEKSVYADGGSLSIFSDESSFFGNIAYVLMTRLG